MARLALTVLSITLGLLFISLGTIKLTPAVSADMHKEMKVVFKNANKVFPFHQLTGWRPKTSHYRKAVGYLELVCGILMVIAPGKIKVFSNLVLLVLMALNVYSAWALGEDLKHSTGPLIFGLLLTCRLAIHMQTVGMELHSKTD